MRLIALDLVRFFAAISVVMYHYTARHGSNSFEILSEVTKFGYLGVPVFFIISGYVITLSAKNRTAFEFAISRFTRLYPVFWTGVAFTVLVTLLFGQTNYSLTQIAANLTILSDYLGYKNIDIVYWTLQAEIKFYACVFLLIFFKFFNKIKIWLSIWLLITTLHLLTKQPFFMGWFISPYYSSFFIAGVAFYLIQQEGRNYYNITILFSSLFISSFHAFNQVATYIINPSYLDRSIAVIFIWLFYLLFYTLITEKISLAKRSYYVTLGGLTYPLYLIHNAAGKAIIDGPLKFLSEGASVSITILLMLLTSYLIHIVIDKRVATPMKSQLFKILKNLTSRVSKPK